VALHVGPDFLKGSSQPALEIDRVQSMDEQQAANRLVPQQAIHQDIAIGSGTLNVPQNTGKAVPIKREQSLETFLKKRASGRAWQALDSLN